MTEHKSISELEEELALKTKQLDEAFDVIGEMVVERNMTRQKESGFRKGHVDFVPFRMWVLFQIKMIGAKELARRIDVSEGLVNKWARGYAWERSGCEPTPIRSIELTTVDVVATRFEDTGLLNRLYPYVGRPDSG